MVLKDRFQKDGNFLFRYRSYLPLFIIPAFILCLLSFEQYLISPLFAYMEGYNVLLVLLALIVGILGQVIRALVAGYVPQGTSGRNTHAQVTQTLNTTGMYSICRNPLYLGNFFMWLSPVLLLGNWLFVVCFVLGFWLYYERIIYAEESFLTQKFQQTYLDWASSTPAFIPKFSSYTKSSLDFSIKTMILREYHSIFGLTSSLFFVHYIIAAYTFKVLTPPLEPIITSLFAISIAFYMIVRVLVKTTNIFRVEGR